MVVSFTKAAAKEAASRGMLADEANIGTLHAICYRALGRPVLAESKIREWNDEHQHLAMASMALDVEDSVAETVSAASQGEECMARIQILRGKMIPQDDWPSNLQHFHTLWTEWKQRRGYYDFTDLIELASHASPWAPGDPRVIFVDEAQDLNPLEISLVRAWSAHTDTTVMVGDADQCLYSFKGSTPHGFLEPELPAEQNLILKQSYRIPAAVHRLASNWITRCSYRYPVEYLPRDFEGEVAHLPAANTHCVRQMIASIETDLSLGKRVMVLAGCSYMLGRSIADLKTAGIPVHNPYAQKRGDWNPMRGGVARMRTFLDGCGRGYWTRSETLRWAEMLEAKKCLVRGGKKRLEELAKRGDPSDKMRFEELYQCFEEASLNQLLGKTEEDRKVTSLDWLRSVVSNPWAKKLEYANRIIERGGESAIDDTPKVVVGTIHSVKGGEADSVYLFPDMSPGASAEWHNGGEARDSVIRQFYVGMTRAKEKLTLMGQGAGSAITWPTSN